MEFLGSVRSAIGVEESVVSFLPRVDVLRRGSGERGNREGGGGEERQWGER